MECATYTVPGVKNTKRIYIIDEMLWGILIEKIDLMLNANMSQNLKVSYFFSKSSLV